MKNGVNNRKIPERHKKSLTKKKKINKKSNLKKCVKENPYCRNCGSSDNVSAHHIIFRSQGGDDSLTNLITLCFNCHRKVHDGEFIGEKFIPSREYMIKILEKIDDNRYEEALKELKYEI